MPAEPEGTDGTTGVNNNSGIKPHPPIQEDTPPQPAKSSTGAQQNNAVSSLESDIKDGERWLIGIGILSIVVNAFIGWVYWSQLGEMRKATEAASSAARTARDTLTISERPWVKARIVPASGLSFDSSGAHVKINITLTNVGNLPALHTWISAELIVITRSTAFEQRQNQLCEAGEKIAPSAGDTLFPGDPEHFKDYPLDIPVADMRQSYVPHQIVTELEGCVTYFSPAGDIHQTGLMYEVYQIDPGVPGNSFIDGRNVPLERLFVQPDIAKGANFAK